MMLFLMSKRGKELTLPLTWGTEISLDTGQSDIHCKIKEALLIRDLKPVLNENIGREKLLLY